MGVACSRLFPQPVGAGAFTWWVGIIAVGVLVLAALQPVARRAQALSGLLQLAIEFPTPPPSRVAAAWRASDPGTVRRQLEQVHTQERSPSLQTDLAVLAATLGVLEHRRRQAEVVFRVGDDDITTRVVESDIPGFFQVVPVGSSSRRVLVIVVASTAAAALAASATARLRFVGHGHVPDRLARGAPDRLGRHHHPASGEHTPAVRRRRTINPSALAPRAGAPADNTAVNPPSGSATVTPASSPAAGETAPRAAPSGPVRSRPPLRNRAPPSAATGAQAPSPWLSAADTAPGAAPVAAMPTTAPLVPAPSAGALSAGHSESPTAAVASAAVAPAAAATDDSATIADAGPVATFALAAAPAAVEPEATASDDTATAPEQPATAPEQPAPAPGTRTQTPGRRVTTPRPSRPSWTRPTVDTPTADAPAAPDAADGTTDANLDAPWARRRGSEPAAARHRRSAGETGTCRSAP